jgi:hypothetical protein
MNYIKFFLKEIFFFFKDFILIKNFFFHINPDIIFFHRDYPFSPGYGAGTYIPILTKKNKKILNIFFRAKIKNHNYDYFYIDSYIILFFLLNNIGNRFSAHIFNQPNLSELVFVLKKLKNIKNVIIEIRSPLINSISFHRKKDFEKSSSYADFVIAPSKDILQSWSKTTFFKRKYLEVPVCIPTRIIKKKNFNKSILKKNKIKFIYAGSMDKKRKLNSLLKSLNNVSKKNNRFSFYFTSPKKKFSENYNYINFIEYVGSNNTHNLLDNFPFGISFLPKSTSSVNYREAVPTKILDYAASGLIILCNKHPSHINMKKKGFKMFFFNDEINEEFILSVIKEHKVFNKMINSNYDLVKKYFWKNYLPIYQNAWNV